LYIVKKQGEHAAFVLPVHALYKDRGSVFALVKMIFFWKIPKQAGTIPFEGTRRAGFGRPWIRGLFFFQAKLVVIVDGTIFPFGSRDGFFIGPGRGPALTVRFGHIGNQADIEDNYRRCRDNLPGTYNLQGYSKKLFGKHLIFFIGF
jgi:hypothetical protein